MSNKKQQTAVEWLAEKITRLEFWVETKQITWKEYHKEKDKLLKQAKEMEKEKMTKAWKAGDGQHDKVADKLAEQWYEQTYGGNK